VWRIEHALTKRKRAHEPYEQPAKRTACVGGPGQDVSIIDELRGKMTLAGTCAISRGYPHPAAWPLPWLVAPSPEAEPVHFLAVAAQSLPESMNGPHFD
jgi:hypothetical protein